MKKKELIMARFNGKHIFLPKKDAKNILEILRSGKIKQGKNALFDGTGYCCLGAMQCYKTGGFVEAFNLSLDGTFKGMPSSKWLKKVGWTFTDIHGYVANDPYLPTLHMTAATANDKGYSFEEIADAMENAIQYI